MVDNTLVEGALKYRDGKKWKQRWAVLDKMSPVADVLQLQLYRDSRDRAKGAATKASLALQNVLALETGFTLDKESHTLGLLCKDVTLVVAFDTRERMLQWQVKMTSTLGEEQQFLVQVLQVPARSRVAAGPARLHVRDHRFCLTTGTPPRLLAAWSTHDLRRYGVVDGRVVWEGGTRCGRWTGVHVALSDNPHAVTHAIDQAARGLLALPRTRPPTASGSRAESRTEMSWLREVSVMDLSSETVSLAASEATATATSPRGDTLPDHNDAHSAAWPPWSRRASCQSQSVVVGGCSTVSSSGTHLCAHEGEEATWWAATWARGSWEGVAAPSPTPESLYDHPRPLGHLHHPGHQPCCLAHHPPLPHPEGSTHITHPPRLALNPLDNYDVPPPPRAPPPPSAHYDTPRRLVMYDSGTSLAPDAGGEAGENVAPTSGVWCEGGLVSAAPGCGQMLGWAGALVCGRREDGDAQSEQLRVDGQGRMPVVDANTGTILRHPPPTPPNSNQPSQETAIYAVVNKRKKTGKPRAPTPPPTPPPRHHEVLLPTSHANYANLDFAASLVLYENVRDVKTAASSTQTSAAVQLQPSSSHPCCGQPTICRPSLPLATTTTSSVPAEAQGGQVAPHLSPTSPAMLEATTITSTCGSGSDSENHYMAMAPRLPSDPHYLAMGPTLPAATLVPCESLAQEREEAKTIPVKDRSRSLSITESRYGRSQSVAPSHRYMSLAPRRSTSADSRPRETWPSSPATTPATTPTRRQTIHSTLRRRDNRLNSEAATDSGCDLRHDSVETDGVTVTPDQSVCTDVEVNPRPDIVTTTARDLIGEGMCILRRSSSVPGKPPANRDSASSSDSGVCESPRAVDRLLTSHCLHASLPRARRPHHSNSNTANTHSGVGASCQELGVGGSVGGSGGGSSSGSGDAKSTSSGASDMSDYLDTLSLSSSHSSSDHDRLLLARSSVNILRPRSGREYTRLDRHGLCQDNKTLPVVGEAPPH